MHATTTSPDSKKIIYALIALVFVAAGFLYYRTNLLRDAQEGAKPQNNKELTAKGALKLVPEGNRTVYEVGEDIVVLLFADSDGKPVAGYDLVFDVSTKDLMLKQAENLIDGFEVFSNSQPDFISVTGVQKFPADDERVFMNEPVARLTFTSVHQGAMDIEFRFIPGETTDSNLASLDAHDLLSKAEGITLHVGSKTMLTKGTPRQIVPGTTLLFDKVIEPNAECRDCMTEAYVKLPSTNNTMIFSFGGLTGVQSDTQTAEGYIFSATNLTPTSLEISWAPLETEGGN